MTIVPRTVDELARIAKVTALPVDFSKAQAFEASSAGAATLRRWRGKEAFSKPSANLEAGLRLDFELGNAMFDKFWVSSPASTKASDGLGPLYNARSCAGCHIRDGRGHAPHGREDDAISMVVRLAVPNDVYPHPVRIDGYQATRPDPNYGGQLHDFSVSGLQTEFQLRVEHDIRGIELNGGEVVRLRKPIYHFDNLGYGPLDPQVQFTPRVAPSMIGLGLLEAIPAADIVALADPEDADGDGISGRVNIVWSKEFEQPMLGRFGLKAGQPTVRQQSAAAFFHDIGLSTPLFRDGHGDCTETQSECRHAIHGDKDERVFEVDGAGLDLVTLYARNLAVPARRDVGGAEVLRGKQVFHESGCAACHRPSFVTHRLDGQQAQSFQLIWPYTDLLLHDMGSGLADGFTEGRASGAEWRTPPLWGVGLARQVSDEAGYLHDGRARTLLEAILWHGGEAQGARDRVVEMEPSDRDALIAFLKSL